MTMNITTDHVKILDNLTREFKRLQGQAVPLLEQMRGVLLKVRDKDYYKARHKTFEAYCEKELGFSRSYAYRLIKAAEVRDQMLALPSPNGGETVAHGRQNKGKPEPDLRERQLRELAKAPEDVRKEILREAAKEGLPTAEKIKTAMAKVVPPADVVERDREGHVVPTPAMATWARRHEVDDYMRQLSKIKSWAEKLQKTTDTFYKVKEFSAQEVFTDCGNLYRMIKNLIPYSICSVCQGQAPDTCALCHGRGMIGQHTWERGVDSQTKAMMKKKAEEA